MAKSVDLIGRKFGTLTVTARAENNHRGNTMWLCSCDCGNTKVALGYDLTHGRTTSCGCNKGKPDIPAENRKDLTGQKFGILEVISLDEKKSKNGILIWKCRCDCGNVSYVRGGNLKSGKVKSCGCLSSRESGNRRKDLSGKRYGKLLVLCEAERVNGKIAWLCKCDCGNEKTVIGNYLTGGTTKSCGCLGKESKKKPKRYTHKLSKSRIYREYHSMIKRCSENYHCRNTYYDKGITVCSEWIGENGFQNFYDWSMKNGYAENLTLDRKDNDKGYSPENCRWTTMKVQQNNKSNNVYIEYMGETKTMKQWCEILGLNYGMVKRRRQCGWEVPRLFEPPHKN